MDLLVGLLIIGASLLVCILPAKTQTKADSNLMLSLILLIAGMLVAFHGLGFSFTPSPQP